MATLKRQKADGTWEIVQGIGGNTANETLITDSGNHYKGTTVEAALTEIGEALTGSRRVLVKEINSILNS